MGKVFGIGETVLDIIFKDGKPMKATAGGSTLNALISLGRLGVDVSFISEYGTDEVGNLIDTFIKENQVNTDNVVRLKDKKSSLALAFLDKNNEASYSFYKDNSEERLLDKEIDFTDEDVFLFGSFFSISKNSRKYLIHLLTQANDSRTTVIYDPNFRKPHLKDLDELLPLIKENISYADIVRGSDEDFYTIFGANSAEQAYKHILENGCSNLIYTANRNQVVILAPGVSLWLDVNPISTISTIGAGDSFNAGIIWTLIREELFKRDLEQLPLNIWQKIGESGIAFSANVCKSDENYISVEFAVDLLQ
ncbi:MAG: carbohydrate kinase [Bacteroidales bacterium]|nr:carbohydrate kinase [Bacteroidales bacterium]MCF8391831.1 carbohydrate kinase [Bacteroidales bacterium]